MRLVVFDLDGTLIEGDSGYEWPRFLAAEGIIDRETCEASFAKMDATERADTFEMDEYLRFQLGALASWPRSQVENWRSRFVQEWIVPIVKPGARALVDRHLQDGDVVTIITGTSRFVTEPIAAELGVQHLIATEAEERDGTFTGRAAGAPCVREGKVERLEAWLGERSLSLSEVTQSRFYANSRDDIPLLSRVSHPVAVDPDERLRRYATEQDWLVISLR